MIWKNPTGIKIGMSGRFFGRTYHVVGRAVLGVMDAGRLYYWNEYYLKADTTELTTLVYERTGVRGEWRWFNQFDPQMSLTVGDLAIKRPGDYVTIDDNTAQIMFVRDSRVYHVEGHAPEGVVAGAHANYFNAKDGDTLFVVSWTGDEVEFYRGQNLTRGTVAIGFKISTAQLVPGETRAIALWATAAVVAFVLMMTLLLTVQSPSRQNGGTIVRLPAPSLKTGAVGTLHGVHYEVIGHAEVEISEEGGTMLRHEYFLRDDGGAGALLLYGWKEGERTWLLFTPMDPTAAPDPREAGGMKLGRVLIAGGVVATVTELFRSTVQEADGTNELNLSVGDVRYGFVGRATNEFVLARWNEQALAIAEGKPLAESEVSSAFAVAK